MRTASSQTSNAVEAASKLLNCFHLKNRKGNSVEFEKATGLKIPCQIERYERIAWFAFHKRYEEAVMSILLSTVAPETSHDMTIQAADPLKDHEQDTLYYIAGWFVRRFLKDVENVTRYKKFKDLVKNWMWTPEQAEYNMMPVRKTILLSRGNLTFACGQVFDMLCEIEKVWRGTVSIAAIWKFKTETLEKSKQLAYHAQQSQLRRSSVSSKPRQKLTYANLWNAA